MKAKLTIQLNKYQDSTHVISASALEGTSSAYNRRARLQCPIALKL